MNLVRVEAPKPVLEVADVKKHLRVDFDDDDAQIDGLIEAATSHIDGETWFGRALGPQTWDLVLGDAEAPTGRDPLKLPLRPVIEIVSIDYVDTADADQTFSAFRLVGAGAQRGPGLIQPTGSWPTLATRPDAMTIRFRAGYAKSDGQSPAGEIEAVPYDIKAGLKLMIGDLYADRERKAADAYTTVDWLLNSWRVWG